MDIFKISDYFRDKTVTFLQYYDHDFAVFLRTS